MQTDHRAKRTAAICRLRPKSAAAQCLAREAADRALRIATTGTQQFDPAIGLQATDASLTLDLSTGFATGNVFVGALDVTYIVPGGANLSGTIAGINGGPAAAVGNIQPAVNTNYMFNGCIIAAAVCQPSSTAAMPRPPLSPASVGQRDHLCTRRHLPVPARFATSLADLPHLVLVAIPLLRSQPPQLTDADVVPPNISYLDY